MHTCTHVGKEALTHTRAYKERRKFVNSHRQKQPETYTGAPIHRCTHMQRIKDKQTEKQHTNKHAEKIADFFLFFFFCGSINQSYEALRNLEVTKGPMAPTQTGYVSGSDNRFRV